MLSYIHRMGKFKGKNSLSDFDERELMEIIIAGQIVIARKLKSIEDKLKINDSETTNDSFVKTFYQLFKDNKLIIEEINTFLDNQDKPEWQKEVK